MTTIKNAFNNFSGIGDYALTRHNKEISIDKFKELSLVKQSDVATRNKEKAVSGFESMLLKEVFKGMWSSIDKSSIFGGDDNASQIYQDMFIQAAADESARGRGMGLKSYLQREMDRSEQLKNQNKVAVKQTESDDI